MIEVLLGQGHRGFWIELGEHMHESVDSFMPRPKGKIPPLNLNRDEKYQLQNVNVETSHGASR